MNGKATSKKTSSDNDYTTQEYVDKLFPYSEKIVAKVYGGGKIILRIPPIEKVYKTLKKQLEMGMCVCSNCGKLCSIDFKECGRCHEEIFVVTK